MSTTIKRFGLNFRSNRKRSYDVAGNFYESETSSTTATTTTTAAPATTTTTDSSVANCGSYELDEIAIVSNSTNTANPIHVHYGSSNLSSTNGLKVIPGIVTSGVNSTHNDSNKSSKSSKDPRLNQQSKSNNYHSSDVVKRQYSNDHQNYKLEFESDPYSNALLASNLSTYRYSPSPSAMTSIYSPSTANSEIDLAILAAQSNNKLSKKNAMAAVSSTAATPPTTTTKPNNDVCHLKIPSLTLTNSTGNIPLLEDNDFWRPILNSPSTTLHANALNLTNSSNSRRQRFTNTSSPGHHSNTVPNHQYSHQHSHVYHQQPHQSQHYHYNPHHLSHTHIAPSTLLNSSNKLCSSNYIHSSTSSCAGFDKCKKSCDNNKTHSKWSFVFDPAGRLCYYWYMIVSVAFLYNFWVIIYRFAFQEINRSTIWIWFCFDYFSDFLYLIDILFHFRMGYLEDGVLQTDATKLRNHYMNSTTFYIDCLCLLPLDFLYLSIGFNSVLRFFRLVKIYRFWAFMDRTERHTNYPNLFRSISLIHYLLVVYHWNGCFYYIIYKNNGFGSRNWVYHDTDSQDIIKSYLQSYYWCTLALTAIGGLPKPRTNGEYAFIILQLLFGLFLLATVLGHVFNIVTSVSAARKEFQAKLDGVKTYMRMRRVPEHLQTKVIKWFDYLWLTQKCSDEEKAVSCLPDKLKAEIAINVHLDTLKRVEIFQNTEAGFLCELVLRLRPVLFSPGDFICRKGEVGKEMYIVNRGKLQVVADNGKTVLATLKAGSYFGEISILNMGTEGNRRTASVRSVGYSDLFVLSKKDMWDVLKEYPVVRVFLESIARKRLKKYEKTPIQKVLMGRSQSTPGLVESRGQVPLAELWKSAVRLGNNQRPPSLSNSSTISSNNQSPKIDLSNTIEQKSQPQPQPQHQQQKQQQKHELSSTSSTNHERNEESLENEIRMLRKRLQTVEAENAAMTLKLNEQQQELQKRLNEIELKFEDTNNNHNQSTSAAAAAAAATTTDGNSKMNETSAETSSTSFEENERNCESFI